LFLGLFLFCAASPVGTASPAKASPAALMKVRLVSMISFS